MNKEQVIFTFQHLFQLKIHNFLKENFILPNYSKENSFVKFNFEIVDAMFTNF